jgi:hypothetical protein
MVGYFYKNFLRSICQVCSYIAVWLEEATEYTVVSCPWLAVAFEKDGMATATVWASSWGYAKFELDPLAAVAEGNRASWLFSCVEITELFLAITMSDVQ